MLRCPTTSNVLTNRERLLAEGFSFHAIILCAVQKPRLHTELSCQRGRSVFASVVLLQDVVFSSDAYKPLSVVSTLARGTNRTSNVSRRNHPPRSSVHFWPFSVGYIFMDRLYMSGKPIGRRCGWILEGFHRKRSVRWTLRWFGVTLT